MIPISPGAAVGNQSVNRNGTNKQAVAEFQGQNMDKDDVSTFFAKEVPNAQPGDDQVSAFVGTPYTKGNGVEALLDIEVPLSPLSQFLSCRAA